MKKTNILLLGLMPIIVGYLINYLIMNFNAYGLPLDIISIIFLLVWFYFGYVTGKAIKSKMQGMLLANGVGILCGLLIAGQMLALGRFAKGYLGLLPQMYFLPTVSIASILDVFHLIHNFAYIYYFALIIMMTVFYLGLRKSQKLY